MARLPESRVLSSVALRDAARTFIDHSLQGLRTASRVVEPVEVVFPSVGRRNTSFLAYTTPHVGPRPLDSWSATGDCLHCSEVLVSPVPVAKYKLDNAYWVFGQFCSPECALGYAREAMMGPQVITWTTAMLCNVFNCPVPIHASPPRFMLARFGGSMDASAWKRTRCIAIRSPPLCTFAMFAECSGKLIAVQNGTIRERPTVRDTMPAVAVSTGKEPVVLRILSESDAPPSSPKRAVKRAKKATTLLMDD